MWISAGDSPFLFRKMPSLPKRDVKFAGRDLKSKLMAVSFGASKPDAMNPKKVRLHAYSDHWVQEIEPYAIQAMHIIARSGITPKSLESRYKALYEAFGLSDYGRPIGFIPPLMWRSGSRPKNAPINTHGALAQIAVQTFAKFPPASNMLEAARQLHGSFLAVDDLAHNVYEQDQNYKGRLAKKGKFSIFRHGKFSTDPRLEKTGGISARGPEILPWRDKLYTTVQASHIVFIASNGATQIVRIPDTVELEKMLGQSLAQVVKECGGIKRTKNSYETDRHVAIYYSRLNYPDLIRKDLIRVDFEKPGLDGRNVWQVVSDENPGLQIALTA